MDKEKRWLEKLKQKLRFCTKGPISEDIHLIKFGFLAVRFDREILHTGFKNITLKHLGIDYGHMAVVS